MSFGRVTEITRIFVADLAPVAPAIQGNNLVVVNFIAAKSFLKIDVAKILGVLRVGGRVDNAVGKPAIDFGRIDVDLFVFVFLHLAGLGMIGLVTGLDPPGPGEQTLPFVILSGHGRIGIFNFGFAEVGAAVPAGPADAHVEPGVLEFIAHAGQHQPFRQVDAHPFFHVGFATLDEETPWIPEVEAFNLERVLIGLVKKQPMARSDHTDSIGIQRPLKQHGF
ncbi:MAG: hypothetical protein BWY72_02503 [Bacteroidetes bacterium ADurb.Bin416]|nr:MAG: hypothetical protein BWY72_02503 [Bacteroidetes bacterium ADurb.Bin416]